MTDETPQPGPEPQQPPEPPPSRPVSPPAPQAQPSAPAPARKRRWKKLLLWTGGIFAGILVLIAVFGPMIISSVARAQIVGALNESLDGSAQLDDFSFSWSGAIRLNGLAVKDRGGRPAFTAKSVAVDVSLLKAIGGSYVADVRIDEPVVFVRRDEAGNVNFSTLAKPAAPKPPGPPAKEGPLPHVKATLTVAKGQILFVDAAGNSSGFTDVSAKVTVDTFDKPVRFEATLAGGSSVKLHGEITIASRGVLDIEHLRGPLGYEIVDVDLSHFQPVTPLRRLEGRLNGTGQYHITSLKALSGKGELELKDLLLEGPAVGPDPVGFKHLRLTDEFEMDAAGTGFQKVILESGDFLTATIDARTQNLAGDNGDFSARLDVSSELKGLAEAAGTLMKLKSGYSLGGRAGVAATVRKDGPRLRAFADVRFQNLSAMDEKGRPLPIDPSLTMELRADVEGMKVVKIDKATLKSGSVSVDARVGMDLDRRTFSDSYLKVNADLDDFGGKLASFLDLGFTFGGKVRIDSTVKGSGDVAEASAEADVSALRLKNFRGKDIGPIDITLRESSTLDLRQGGRTVLQRFELRSGLLDADARGEVTDVLDERALAGAITFTAQSNPAALQEKLGGLFEGYEISGSPIAMEGELRFAGRKTDARAKLKTGGITVGGPDFGIAILRDVALGCDLALNDGGTEVRDVSFTSPSIEVTLKDAPKPIVVRGTVVKGSGSVRGDVVDFPRFELACSAASGSGSVRMKGAETTGKAEFRGEIGPLMEITGAFSEMFKDAKGTGAWEASADVEMTGGRTAAKGKLAAPQLAIALPEYELKSRMDVTFDLGGEGGRMKASIDAAMADFAATGSGGVKVSEPKIELKAEADVATEAMDVTIRSAELKSGIARGTVTGAILKLKTEPEFRALNGDFRYVPDRLGAVLQPWLGGRLSGAEEKKVTFTLDGRAKELDMLAVLRGASGSAALDSGRFTTDAFDLVGGLSLTLADQHAKAQSGLDLNGGKAAIAADADLRESPDAVSTASFDVKKIGANAGMSPLLALIHPLFAVAGGKADATISGIINASIQLEFRGPLTKKDLESGWEGFPKQPINGKGSFEISDLRLRGAPLLGEVADALGERFENFEMEPISFTIRDGRLTYDRPIKMKFAGEKTEWTGSVGLDQKLDLVWSIPVSDRLVGKYPYLKYFRNEVLRIPVEGTATSPTLGWKRILAELAEKAAKKEIEESVQEGLEGLLGRKADKEAKKLLEQADQLYGQGKKRDAAVLYRRLNDEYSGTKTYKNNRDRIRQRMTES